MLRSLLWLTLIDAKELRESGQVQEPIAEDHVDTLMMLQEMYFVYPDLDMNLDEFNMLWTAEAIRQQD